MAQKQLNQMNDAELDALYKKEIQALKSKPVDSLSDEDLDMLYEAEGGVESEPSEVDNLLSMLSKGIPESAKTLAKTAVDAFTAGYYPQFQEQLNKGFNQPGTAAEERFLLEQQQKENPNAEIIGTVTGTLAGSIAGPETLLAKVPGIKQAASLIEKVPVIAGPLKSAAAGAAYRAIQNPGEDVSGENSFQIDKRIQNILQPEAVALDVAVGTGGKLMQKLINPKNAAIRALGLGKRDVESAMQKAEESTQNLDRVIKYAKDSGILTAGQSSEGIFKKSSERLQQVGKELGDLRSKVDTGIIDSLLASDEKFKEQYIKNSFNLSEEKIADIVERTKQAIIDSGGTDSAQRAAIREVEDRLKRLKEKTSIFPNFKDMLKLKQEIDSSIYSKGKAIQKFGITDESLKKEALSFLSHELDKGLVYDAEVYSAFVNDKKLLNKLNDLKKQYSTLQTINTAARSKLSGEMANASRGSDLLKTVVDNTVLSTPVQSTAAVITDKIKIPPTLVPRSFQAMTARPTILIEGYDIHQTEAITDLRSIPEMETSIQNDLNLSNIEKAKRLNLIRKHGRVYIGN